MRREQIFSEKPGSVHLLWCEDARAAAGSVLSPIPGKFGERAALNACVTLSMDMTGEESPNGFHDLSVLCARLIVAAGRQSRFEGLLTLNVGGLMKRREDHDRLRALGEVLLMRDGPASRCVTVLVGPESERDCLLAADCLDFDGRLITGRLDREERARSLGEMLVSADLSCASEQAARLIRETLDAMAGEKRFEPVRFLRSCAADGRLITLSGVRAALDDPLSYVNRVKKLGGILRWDERKIGFGSDL